MKKITIKIHAALIRGNSCVLSNTRTDGQSVWLYNTVICMKSVSGNAYAVTCGGSLTKTTLSRVNDLLALFNAEYSLRVSKGQLYKHNHRDGTATRVDAHASIILQ